MTNHSTRDGRPRIPPRRGSPGRPEKVPPGNLPQGTQEEAGQSPSEKGDPFTWESIQRYYEDR